MKKIVALLSIAILGISSVQAYTSSQLDAANILAADGIINDNASNPTAYNLDQNVLRQEIAAVARWVAGISKTTSCNNSFSDVSSSNPNTWACYSVEALLNADLIASNSTFRPEADITKAEGLGMLVKAACGDDYAYDSSKGGSWQEQIVDYASEQLIVSKFTDYNTAATRGWVFEVGASAMTSCGEDKEALDILEELLEWL